MKTFLGRTYERTYLKREYLSCQNGYQMQKYARIYNNVIDDNRNNTNLNISNTKLNLPNV